MFGSSIGIITLFKTWWFFLFLSVIRYNYYIMLATKDLSKTQITKFEKIIKQDYPDFIIKSIKPLKSGWDNFVLEINKTYIFRFPKKEAFNLNKEIKILDYLKGKITLEIPCYEFVGKTIKYVGYKKIIGKPLLENTLKSLNAKERNILANDVAKFFYEFHSALLLINYRKFKLEKDSQSWRPLVIKKNVINKIKNQELSTFIENSLDKYLELSKDKTNLVIAYNDLHGNNMAFDKKLGRLNGIFDFSDVAIEDIHREFCSLFSLDQELTISIIKRYEKLSKRKIDISKVFITAVVCEASILGVFINKPESKNYKYALNDLLYLKSVYLKYI